MGELDRPVGWPLPPPLLGAGRIVAAGRRQDVLASLPVDAR